MSITNIDITKLAASIKSDEGLRLRVYDDATGDNVIPGYCMRGHPTIGYGRALDVNGISEVEANFLLSGAVPAVNDSDIVKSIAAVSKAFPWTSTLDEVRCRVLVEMSFNMGIGNLLQFHNTLIAVQNGRYIDAATGMLDSQWARQVGTRANKLADMMRTGAD